MDKLNRYNQKLLAIIGTAAIAAAGLALLIAIGGLIVSLIDFSSPRENGLRTQNVNETSEENKEIIRTQEVSFNAPYQLDTAQAKYLIAVGQVNLKESERISMGSGRSNKFSYYTNYGLFNNFIYFDYEKGLNKKLFDEKVAITQWAFLQKDSIEVLLFKGTSTDDNSDNQMNGDDYQTLFAYYLSDEKLKRYDFSHKTVLDFSHMQKTDLVAIELGVDKDQNYAFESSKEPQEITTLNISTRQIQAIVAQEVKNEIQSIVDGLSN